MRNTRTYENVKYGTELRTMYINLQQEGVNLKYAPRTLT